MIGAVRGLDREAGRAGGADADRRRHRRQLGQPDDHDDRARASRMGQVQPRATRASCCVKELGVALFNGLVWGGLLGLIAWWLYKDVPLGLVMTAAMTLNLLLAATVGVLIPLTHAAARRATRRSARRC
ncbi:MAG: magnesium transporter [Comamonadaceae bacterium]|nr:magnesium transporter [Comamonadaceae bacterium]